PEELQVDRRGAERGRRDDRGREDELGGGGREVGQGQQGRLGEVAALTGGPGPGTRRPPAAPRAAGAPRPAPAAPAPRGPDAFRGPAPREGRQCCCPGRASPGGGRPVPTTRIPALITATDATSGASSAPPTCAAPRPYTSSGTNPSVRTVTASVSSIAASSFSV